jgi:hypothetical protein
LFPLTDRAGQSGLPGDGSTSLPAECFIGTQGSHWLAQVCQAMSQDEGVFQGLTRPLPEVGGGGMSSIAARSPGHYPSDALDGD